MLTSSYINTALSQSAFRIYKCYIIMVNITQEHPIVASMESYEGRKLVIKSLRNISDKHYKIKMRRAVLLHKLNLHISVKN